MDPISPLLNINQKQKQAPAPAPTLTVRDAPRQKCPYEMRPKRCRACLQGPVRKEGTQGPREKCCLGRGNPPGATCCRQVLAFYIMDGNYLCSASPAPRVPGRQRSLMALLLSEIKPPSVFFSPPYRANPHEHKSLQASVSGAEGCNGGGRGGLQNVGGCTVQLVSTGWSPSAAPLDSHAAPNP